MAFAKLKAHLRAAATTFDALWKAIGNICDLFNRTECWNYLKKAGYASDALELGIRVNQTLKRSGRRDRRMQATQIQRPASIKF